MLAQCNEAGKGRRSGIRGRACLGLPHLQSWFLHQRLLDSSLAEPTLCSHKANPRQSKRGTGEDWLHCPGLTTRPRPAKRRRNGTKRSGLWLPRLWLGSPWCFPNYRCRFPGLPLLQTATCHPHSPPAAALLPRSLQGDTDLELEHFSDFLQQV